MSLPIPDLDDKTFEELVEDAKKLIPVHAPEWTDYNLHDPGITLIELFAYLVEMQIYSINQVNKSHLCKYLRLLGLPVKEKEQDGTGEKKEIDCSDEKALQRAFYDFRAGFKTPGRAVTSTDYETLVKSIEGVNRAKAFVKKVKLRKERKEEGNENDQNSVIKVLVIIYSENTKLIKSTKEGRAFIKKIGNSLRDKRLLGTWVEVIEAELVDVSVTADITIKPGFRPGEVKKQVKISLNKFLSPLGSGIETDSEGWPFGSPVYRSDVYRVIDEVPGVECVGFLKLAAAGDNYRYDDDKNILIGPNCLVRFGSHNIRIIDTGTAFHGGDHEPG